jgi:UDP-N-acetylglucosamine:LPS N-acetylglucosamine transferase
MLSKSALDAVEASRAAMQLFHEGTNEPDYGMKRFFHSMAAALNSAPLTVTKA